MRADGYRQPARHLTETLLQMGRTRNCTSQYTTQWAHVWRTSTPTTRGAGIHGHRCHHRHHRHPSPPSPVTCYRHPPHRHPPSPTVAARAPSGMDGTKTYLLGWCAPTGGGLSARFWRPSGGVSGGPLPSAVGAGGRLASLGRVHGDCGGMSGSSFLANGFSL